MTMALNSFIVLVLTWAVYLAQAYQYEDLFAVASSNLTVTTRTGTFMGDLNDTYPAVRQFKYVPYAKVKTSDSILTHISKLII